MTVFVCAYCFGHAASAAELPQAATSPQQIALDKLRQTAYEDWKEGRLASAADRYQEILRLSKSFKIAAEQHAKDLQSMGALCGELGHYEDAKAYYSREVEVLRGSGNPAAAGQAYLSVAGILQIEGSFSEAETSYQNAIEALSRSAGTKDIRTAAALNGLGWLYTLWGRTEEAGRLLEKARVTAEKSLAPGDPRLIHFVDAQASFLATTGRYSEAEKLWKQAIEIGEKAYPGQERNYDEVFLHLGQVYAITHDYGSAEAMFQRFLAIDKQAIGPSAAIRAVATAEIARIYTDEHKYGNAELLFSQSLQMMESERNKVPLSYSLIQSYLGDYYMERSRWRDAEKQYRNALQMRIAMLGEHASDVAASMVSLSKALRKLHRKKEANQYLAQASSIAAVQQNPVYRAETIDVRAFREK